MKHGTYVGPLKHLQGEMALIDDDLPAKKNKVMVQFDNIESPFGHGWHMFDKSDWRLDRTERMPKDINAGFWVLVIVLCGIAWAVAGRLVQ